MKDEELEDIQLTIAQSTCMLAGYILRADGALSESEERTARLLAELVVPEEMRSQEGIEEMMRLVEDGEWSEGAAQTACNILSTTDEIRHMAIAQMTQLLAQTEPMTSEKRRALRQVLTWLDAPTDRIRSVGESERGEEHGGDESDESVRADVDEENAATVVINSLALASAYILWANRQFYPEDRELVKKILDGVGPGLFEDPEDAPETDEMLNTLETGTPKTDYVRQGCAILANMEDYREVFMELMTKLAVQSRGELEPKRKALQEVLTWLNATPGEIHQIFSMIDNRE